jgi:hypothetical protein
LGTSQRVKERDISSDDEINDYLKADGQILGLPAPAPAARVCDFSLQREVNQVLGGKQ